MLTKNSNLNYLLWFIIGILIAIIPWVILSL
jgi:hypothetical protein